MSNIAQELRKSAKETFYDPLKSELNRAADCIDKLTEALIKIRDMGDNLLPKLDMTEEETLWTVLAGCMELSRKTLEETCSD